MIQTEPFTILSAADTTGYKPSFFKRKAYPYWCFEYIHRGAGILIIESETFKIDQGDVYLLPKGLDHHYEPDMKNPWDKYYMVVDGPLISALLKSYKIQDMYHFPKTNIAKQILEIISLFDTNAQQIHERSSIIFHEIVQIMSHQNAPNSIKLNSLTARIKHYLDKNVERQIKLEELEREFKISKPNIVRTFKKEFNITPYEYFIRKKIEVSKYYLIETDMRIKEIADRLCFHDEFHLSKLFKQKTGQTPSQFRTLHIQS